MNKYWQILLVAAAFLLLAVAHEYSNSAGRTIKANPMPSSSASSVTPNASSAQSAQITPTPSVSPSSSPYINGTYTGSAEDASYGTVQVKVTVTNGQLSNVAFVQYPNDNPTSSAINAQAMPLLKSEAIQAQGAQVSGVSGASFTSQAFQASLSSAIQQAANQG